MTLIYTKNDLTNLAAKFQCCAADISSSALKAEKYNFKDKKCYLNKLLYLNKSSCILKNYTPEGTVIEEGFVATATLDMTTIVTFDKPLVGNIIVDGNIIGVIPEANYADLQALITVIVSAINTGGSGYTAVDNGNFTITLNAPGSGLEANGFVITININPSFGLDKTITDIPKGWQQIIHIDNPSSTFHDYNVVVSAATTGIGPNPNQYNVVGFKGDATSATDFVTVTLSQNIGGHALSYDPINDQLYVGGFIGAKRIGVIKPGFSYNPADEIAVSITPGPNPNPTATAGFNRAYYNATNQATYFTMPTNNNAFYQFRTILKLDSDGTQTHIIVQVDYLTNDLRINPANGNMWLVPQSASVIKNVKIINPAGTILTTIAPANYIPVALGYYPGTGVAGTERMLISFDPILPAVDYRIASYKMDGTLDNANFYTSLSSVKNIHYSSIWNTIFLTNSASDVVVLRIDGTLKQTIVGVGNNGTGFVDDENFNYTIGTETIFLTPRVADLNFFTLSDDGQETADGALEEGTPDVLQEADDNCLSEEQIQNIIEVSNSLCCNC